MGRKFSNIAAEKPFKNSGNEPKTGIFADIKNDLIAMAGEFIGTILFLLFSLGAVQTASTNTNSNASDADKAGTEPSGSDSNQLLTYYYVSAAFGLSLFATASIFYRFTGSIFNPSVSLALCLIGAIKPLRFILVSLAQMVGAIVASAILDGLTPGALVVNVGLANGTNKAQGLFIEMFTTATLVLSVLMLAAEKHLLTPFAPLGFGFTLFIVMLFSIAFTGGAVNTARAFGPACIQGFQPYHWIYWLGPTLGALLATAFYVFLKEIKYWRITPGQDSTDNHESPKVHPVTSRMSRNRNDSGSETTANDGGNNVNTAGPRGHEAV
ncbi:hypothetical protein I302_109086 [Kwoniella bestiolae CBS 10118]|uniref:Aquaporin rerated protein, other eukaryote n=1 Tax=Kwoniella bestiolae CBS 10118 TaxID=1296100 RepID=A0A1B9FUZ1_9TREE|nr:hypothetical protein I302_08231 [Kwoniella bestiolae CBS 10118]OCF22581.1 hypothetical protein I302_08231 [Kwoniella bestiolae CBS 10118]